jgi:HAD phosphatase, family IIIA
MKYFKPDIILDRVFDLNVEKLKKNRIKGVIFDIDNTLAYNAESEPDEKVTAFLKALQKEGFQIALVSNNNKMRVTTYNQNLKLPHIYRACKPLKFKLSKIIKAFGIERKEACMVGDQLFTDIWGGKRMGMFTVLVKPFDDNEERFIRFKRKVEHFFLR